MGMIVNPFASSGGTPPVTDPLFSLVVALLHFGDGNGATTYADSSSYARGFTNFVNTSVTTTSPLFGSGCLDVAAGRAESTNTLAYGIGPSADFSVQLRFRSANAAANYVLYDHNGFGTGAFEITQESGTYKFWNGSYRITGGTATAGSFVDLEVSRISSVTRMFFQGSQVGSDYADTTDYTAGPIYIGAESAGGEPSTGQYAEYRFTNGAGRHSTNFTPATAPFPNS